MALPKKYPLTLQPVVPTYNFSDVEEGTGVITYYGFTAEKSTGEQYILTTQQPFSHLVSFSGSLGTNASVSGSFLTGELNKPRILQGTAVVNMTWRVTNSTSSNQNFPFAQLRKYDGSNYTLIGETSGNIINSASGVMRTTALKITDIPATLIKIGEQVNINVGIVGADAGNTPKGFVACDPQNRDDDWFTTGNFDTTKLIANIPSRIVSIT